MRGWLLGAVLVAAAGAAMAQREVRVPPAIIVKVAAEVLQQVDICPAGAAADCTTKREAFGLQYQSARIGNIQAQREVSTTLLLGDGPVRQNVVDACAWIGLVIGQMGRTANDFDKGMYLLACQGLRPAQLDQAQVRLNVLRELIAADVKTVVAQNRR